jgi:putative FmdB family regulatory protein
MPIYAYRCNKCGRIFEELYLSLEQAALGKAKCPECNAAATRDFSNQRFNAPANPYAGELSEDSEEYREMHYYEKKKTGRKPPKPQKG